MYTENEFKKLDTLYEELDLCLRHARSASSMGDVDSIKCCFYQAQGAVLMFKKLNPTLEKTAEDMFNLVDNFIHTLLNVFERL